MRGCPYGIIGPWAHWGMGPGWPGKILPPSSSAQAKPDFVQKVLEEWFTFLEATLQGKLSLQNGPSFEKIRVKSDWMASKGPYVSL